MSSSANVKLIPASVHLFFQQVENKSNNATEQFYVKGTGRQELVPGSGVYISSVRLHSIHSQCETEKKKLFLLLVEAFFSEERLATSLAWITHANKHGFFGQDSKPGCCEDHQG